MSLESAFIGACKENPNDPLHFMAYRDWLLDNGREADAEKLSSPVSQIADLCRQTLASVRRDGDDVNFTLLDGRKFHLTPIHD